MEPKMTAQELRRMRSFFRLGASDAAERRATASWEGALAESAPQQVVWNSKATPLATDLFDRGGWKALRPAERQKAALRLVCGTVKAADYEPGRGALRGDVADDVAALHLLRVQTVGLPLLYNPQDSPLWGAYRTRRLDCGPAAMAAISLVCRWDVHLRSTADAWLTAAPSTVGSGIGLFALGAVQGLYELLLAQELEGAFDGPVRYPLVRNLRGHVLDPGRMYSSPLVVRDARSVGVEPNARLYLEERDAWLSIPAIVMSQELFLNHPPRTA